MTLPSLGRLPGSSISTSPTKLADLANTIDQGGLKRLISAGGFALQFDRVGFIDPLDDQSRPDDFGVAFQ